MAEFSENFLPEKNVLMKPILINRLSCRVETISALEFFWKTEQFFFYKIWGSYCEKNHCLKIGNLKFTNFLLTPPSD